MNDDRKCGAHDLLLSTVSNIEKGQSKLYDLDREKSDRLGEIKVSVARIETSQKAGFELIASEQKLQYAELLAEIKKRPPQKHWGPGHTAAVICAGLAAMATILASCFGGK